MEIVGKMKDFPRKIETGAGKAGMGGGGLSTSNFQRY